MSESKTTYRFPTTYSIRKLDESRSVKVEFMYYNCVSLSVSLDIELKTTDTNTLSTLIGTLNPDYLD